MNSEEFEPATHQEPSDNDTSALKDERKDEVRNEPRRQEPPKHKTILLYLLSILVGRVLYKTLTPAISFTLGNIVGSVPFLARILAPQPQGRFSPTLTVFSCLSLLISAIPTVFLCKKICGRMAPICVYTICLYIFSAILNIGAFHVMYVFLYFVVILTFGIILILDIAQHKKCPPPTTSDN